MKKDNIGSEVDHGRRTRGLRGGGVMKILCEESRALRRGKEEPFLHVSIFMFMHGAGARRPRPQTPRIAAGLEEPDRAKRASPKLLLSPPGAAPSRATPNACSSLLLLHLRLCLFARSPLVSVHLRAAAAAAAAASRRLGGGGLLITAPGVKRRHSRRAAFFGEQRGSRRGQPERAGGRRERRGGERSNTRQGAPTEQWRGGKRDMGERRALGIVHSSVTGSYTAPERCGVTRTRREEGEG